MYDLIDATHLKYNGHVYKAPYPDHECPGCNSEEQPIIHDATPDDGNLLVDWQCPDCGHQQIGETWVQQGLST